MNFFPAMRAKNVIRAAAAAGAPEWIAAHAIKHRQDKQLVQKTLAEFSGVQDACAQFGIDAAVVCDQTFDNGLPAMLGALITEVLAIVAEQNEISPRRAIEPNAIGVVSTAETYDRRKVAGAA